MLRELIDMYLYLPSSNFSMINNLEILENTIICELKKGFIGYSNQKEFEALHFASFFISDTTSRVLLFHGISVLIKY